MKKTFVRTAYGYICIPKTKPEYRNAKHIHCMGCSVIRPRKYFAKVYYCKVCERLKKADKEYWIKHREDL
jgi:hypothetical protein